MKAARKVIEEYVKTGKTPKVDLPETFDESGGVFVTLKIAHDLRGCIGYPYPDYPLNKALVQAAVQAATEDPRFPRVRSSELGRINVEVTILTEPELLRVKASDRPEHIVIGRDGLIIEYGLYRGLLLPQVPVEWHWDPVEYLENACMKAGIMPDAWVDEKTKVYTFTGQIFEECEPNGRIVEKKTDRSLDQCRTEE